MGNNNVTPNNTNQNIKSRIEHMVRNTATSDDTINLTYNSTSSGLESIQNYTQNGGARQKRLKMILIPILI